MLYVKYGENRLHGFRGDVVWKCWRRTTTTDGRRMPAYTISSPSPQVRWANKIIASCTVIKSTVCTSKWTLCVAHFSETVHVARGHEHKEYNGVKVSSDSTVGKVHDYVVHNKSRSMIKPTKWHVRPAKTRISLSIHPVWSVFAMRSMDS